MPSGLRKKRRLGFQPDSAEGQGDKLKAYPPFAAPSHQDVARSNANLPVPQWQKDELERRRLDFMRNPTRGSSWDEVKTEILHSR